MERLRTIAAVWGGKAAGAASRAFGRGGGTAIAGLVAERIDPAIVARLGRQAGAGAICITGTNGKTTTSLMLSGIAAEAGLAPLHNRSGSNLMRGLAATFSEAASIDGSIPDAARRIAILEVDEATLPYAVDAVRPRAIVFTNLFRDQLDRYGEVDTVAKAWGRALSSRRDGDSAEPVLVLNADDPAVAHLAGSARGGVLTYGIDDATAAGSGDEHASDFRTCLNCGGALQYSAAFYGHVGHWRCPRCGNARMQPDVRATRVVVGEDATALEIVLPDGKMNIALPLPGVYNAYNALAAVAGATALGLPRDAIARALEGFSAAFGRQEQFSIDGRDVRVVLGKNPTGLNQVLRTLSKRPGEKRWLFVLNDGIADGRDISWIWDADYELAREGAQWAMAAGTRAEDMALRLKYAGFEERWRPERETATAVQRAIERTPAGGTLYIVPTYTAMLEVREMLAKRGGQRRYWEGA
jgi:UDP-N-acetylmuramyl tripeptide synthase